MTPGNALICKNQELIMDPKFRWDDKGQKEAVSLGSTERTAAGMTRSTLETSVKNDFTLALVYRLWNKKRSSFHLHCYEPSRLFLDLAKVMLILQVYVVHDYPTQLNSCFNVEKKSTNVRKCTFSKDQPCNHSAQRLSFCLLVSRTIVSVKYWNYFPSWT